jgi:hypothetical protein
MSACGSKLGFLVDHEWQDLFVAAGQRVKWDPRPYDERLMGAFKRLNIIMSWVLGTRDVAALTRVCSFSPKVWDGTQLHLLVLEKPLPRDHNCILHLPSFSFEFESLLCEFLVVG